MRATQIRELARRLASVTPRLVRNQSLQSPCTLIVKDYELLPSNAMKAADPAYSPFLCSLTTFYTHPIGEKIGAEPEYIRGSSFPVAPNILLTAAHCVFSERLGSAGYEVSSIESRQPQFSPQPSSCISIQNVSKKDIGEKDPVTNEEWILPKDYTFVRVEQPVPRWSKFLIPRVAQEGDTVVFPALRPNIARDVLLVNDIKYALILAFQYGGLTEDEARDRAHQMQINLEALQQLVGVADMIQGEGRILKVAHGLMAHNSPFFRGMSGTFGSVAPGTFSCIGISSGTGSISPGTNYNVSIDINRDDFKEDYAAIVLPNLPADVRHKAEKFLNAK